MKEGVSKIESENLSEFYSPRAFRFLKLVGEIDEKYIITEERKDILVFAKVFMKVAAVFCIFLFSSLLVFSLLPGGDNETYVKLTISEEAIPVAGTSVFTENGVCFLAVDNDGTYVYATNQNETQLLGFISGYFPENYPINVENSILKVTLLDESEKKVFTYELSVTK